MYIYIYIYTRCWKGGLKPPLPARHFVFVKPEQKPKTSELKPETFALKPKISELKLKTSALKPRP